MTIDELLSCAIAFDGGPPPVEHGWILDEDDACSCPIQVRRTKGQWTITRCEAAMSFQGKWVQIPRPSNRGGRQYGARFATPTEALEFLAEWKAKERRKAADAGLKRWKERAT